MKTTMETTRRTNGGARGSEGVRRAGGAASGVAVRKALRLMREGEGVRIEAAGNVEGWRGHRRPAGAVFLVTARASGDFVAWFSVADKAAWDSATVRLVAALEGGAA